MIQLKTVLLFLITAMLTVISANCAFFQNSSTYLRVARIVVDSMQLGNYKVALKEGMETAVRVEPDVISLYAVYEKDDPTI